MASDFALLATPDVADGDTSWGGDLRPDLLSLEAQSRVFSPFGSRGAVGDLVTVDQAAIELAIADCVAAGGGFVGPLGQHLMDDELELPDKVHLFGRGVGYSGLVWQTDLGAGKFAVKCPSSPGSGTAAGSIRDTQILGPGGNTLGVRGCNMDGVRLGPHSPMRDCYISGFGSGLVLPYDHNLLDHVDIRNNFYGVLFPPAPGTKGNHTFVACPIVSNKFASVALAGDNTMDQVLFKGSHMGFGPYCIYRADMGAASSQSGVSGCVFDACTFEYVGNAIMRDVTTGSGPGLNSIIGTTFNRCSYTASNDTTNHRINTAGTFDYAFDCRWVTDTDWHGGTQPLAVPPGGKGLFRVTFADETFRYHQGLPPTGAGQFLAGWIGSTVEGYGATGHGYIAGGTITTGDLLAWTAPLTVSRMTAATVGAYAGAAMNDADVVNNVCIVAKPGSTVAALCEPVTAGVKLYPKSGTEHHLSPTVNGTALARAFVSGGAGGGAAVRVQLLGV